jgi:N-methylhydantoinase A
MHERIYTIKDEDEVVEFTTWKVRAIGNTGGAGRRGRVVAGGADRPAPKARRPVYLGVAGGLTEIAIFDGRSIVAGVVIEGPAIIEEPTTTFLMLPGQRAETDAYGNYIAEIRA